MEVYVVTVYTCPSCPRSVPTACFTSEAKAQEFGVLHIADTCMFDITAVPLDKDIHDF